MEYWPSVAITAPEVNRAQAFSRKTQRPAVPATPGNSLEGVGVQDYKLALGQPQLPETVPYHPPPTHPLRPPPRPDRQVKQDLQVIPSAVKCKQHQIKCNQASNARRLPSLS